MDKDELLKKVYELIDEQVEILESGKGSQINDVKKCAYEEVVELINDTEF